MSVNPVRLMCDHPSEECDLIAERFGVRGPLSFPNVQGMRTRGQPVPIRPARAAPAVAAGQGNRNADRVAGTEAPCMASPPGVSYLSGR